MHSRCSLGLRKHERTFSSSSNPFPLSSSRPLSRRSFLEAHNGADAKIRERKRGKETRKYRIRFSRDSIHYTKRIYVDGNYARTSILQIYRLGSSQQNLYHLVSVFDYEGRYLQHRNSEIVVSVMSFIVGRK